MVLGGDNMANKFIDRTGETTINKQGLKMKIIKYNGCLDIDVEFEDGYIATNVKYAHFKESNIKNPYFKTVLNIGCVGNVSTIDENKKQLKSYTIWKSMLQRCYDINCKNYKNYGGKGVVVCDEWLCYENFKKWYDEYYYEVDGERTELDKDILIKGNKIYSPESCNFVPKNINILFKKHKKQYDLPLGVLLHKGKYASQLRSHTGKTKWLGYFNTPEEAFYVYKEAKEKEIKRVADLYKDKIPQKLYKAMYSYEVEITD